MCEFKTGDVVLARGFYTDGEWMERIFLYSRKNGLPVCQSKECWEAGSTDNHPILEIKPIPHYEERVIGPVQMMQWLVDHGYISLSNGSWGGRSPGFNHQMWQYCGKKKPDCWYWHPEWIEKVEVK